MPNAELIVAMGLGEYKYPHFDCGVESWSKRPRLDQAMWDLACGIYFGYPLCCVEEYCLDTVEGRLSGWRRRSVPDGHGNKYVPCSKCCEEMGRLFIP